MRGSKIVKRSGESWLITQELPRGEDGKRRQKRVIVRGSKRDAERYLAEIQKQLSRGDEPCAAVRS